MFPPPSRTPSRPRVSVIIPAYNAEPWLPDTLDSVCSQSLREIEILVVDDGSTDRTLEIAGAFAGKDQRIRVIQQQNGGVGAARNRAIAEARGDYIAPLDADDLWYPEKLALQLKCMEEGGEEMGFAYCWSEKIDPRGKLITDSFPFDSQGSVLNELVARNFVGNASVPLFRASALKVSGVYLQRSEQEGVQGCEDWELILRIAEKYRVGLVPQTLVKYRQLPGCMSLNAREMGRSYEYVMQLVKERNPGLPRSLFQGSAANFYSYLVSKCSGADDPENCLWALAKAIKADPKLMSNPRFQRMGLKNLAKLVFYRLGGGAALPLRASSMDRQDGTRVSRSLGV